MALVLNQELTMLRDSVSGYLSDFAPVGQLRRLRDENSTLRYDLKTWAKMSQMGWLGVIVPEKYGGVDMGLQAAGVISEEMGKHLTASPYISTSVMGVTALVKFGSERQKNTWLPTLVKGETIIAVAVDEGRTHQPDYCDVRAERSGNGFKLTGDKKFVADGTNADLFLISARTSGGVKEKDGITVFLIEKGVLGLALKGQAMVDSRDTVSLNLNNIEVSSDDVLGEIDGGRNHLEPILDAGRVCLAAELLGPSQECLQRTLIYIKNRSQFGKAIGSFQGIQHRVAHLYSEVELSKSIVIAALQSSDKGQDDAPMMVSAAKSKLGSVAQLAAQEAIQMHGGIGMTDEYDIGFFIKRIRVADAMLGGSSFHADRFASLRGY